MNKSEVISLINKLYITRRNKYLVQYKHKYVTVTNSKQRGPLNDKKIDDHLSGKSTYGVFSKNSYETNFICFDVDFVDKDLAKYVAAKLVFILTHYFSISLNSIAVSLSGSKGYHVDIFFSNFFLLADCQDFFEVIKKHFIEEESNNKGKIEFRPTGSQGIKLPLGKNQMTSVFCFFCDPLTLDYLDRETSYQFLKRITPIENFPILYSRESVTSNKTLLTKNEVKKYKDKNIGGTEKAIKILTNNRLLHSNSRHESTLIVSQHLLSEGYNVPTIINRINQILRNTPKEMFSNDSTQKYREQETIRIVKICYEKGYRLREGNKEQIKVFKSELIFILLNLHTFRTREMGLLMLMTSKRYGNPFYLTIEKAKEFLGINSRETIQNSIKRMVECGFLTVERSKEIDKEKTKEANNVIYKPNLYRINKSFDESEYLEVPYEECSLINLCRRLFSDKEIRGMIKRSEYNNRWKQSS